MKRELCAKLVNQKTDIYQPVTFQMDEEMRQKKNIYMGIYLHHVIEARGDGRKCNNV